MIKKDKDGNKYVEIDKEKFYVDDISEVIDDILDLIKSLREVQKYAEKFEDEELIGLIHKKIIYYTTILREIYSD